MKSRYVPKRTPFVISSSSGRTGSSTEVRRASLPSDSRPESSERPKSSRRSSLEFRGSVQTNAKQRAQAGSISEETASSWRSTLESRRPQQNQESLLIESGITDEAKLSKYYQREELFDSDIAAILRRLPSKAEPPPAMETETEPRISIDKQRPEGTPFSLLPDVLILIIFDSTPQWAWSMMQCVCRKWRDLCLRNHTHLELPVGCLHRLTPEMLGRMIRFIDLGACSKFVLDDHISMVAASSPLLEQVHLRMCRQLSDAALLSLEACPNITHLDLYCCDRITDLGLISVSVLSQLRHLCLAFCSMISDDGVRCLAFGHCPRLEFIDCRVCVRITDHGVGALADSSPFLKHIDFTSCALVSSDFILPLAPLAALTSVSLSRCHTTDDALCALGRGCPSLVSLDVAKCAQVSDVGVVGLASGCARVLERLVLTGCRLISDESVHAVSRCFSATLTHLSVAHCPRITSMGIASLGRCDRLLSLSLTGCYRLEDAGVRALASRCTRLERLELDGCSELSDQSVHVLANVCRRLAHVDVCGCPRVTEAGAEALARGGRCEVLK